tara:strand:- start:105 stop:623 length:519 start_codon:yes stop_codon:yes gene_type:complete
LFPYIKEGAMMVKMDGDKLVETWQICAGWAEEFCINTWDHKDGLDQPAIRVFVKSENKGYDSRSEEQNFPGFVSEPFKMRPICNYHINNGDFPHPSGNSISVTKETWELLIQMCGYMAEEEGDICFETDLIPPILNPLKFTDTRSERKENEMQEGEMLTLARYAAKTMGLLD